MRVHLDLSPSTSLVPFNHLPALTGAIHKWIGEQNEMHDATSLYSFSWLQGARKAGNGLRFDGGASFFFSAWDRGLVQRLVSGVLRDASFAHGMRVTDIRLQEPPEFGERAVFRVASPVLVKKPNPDRGTDDHLLYDNPESSELMTQVLQRKLRLAGLDDAGVRVAFDADYPQAKAKLVRYKSIGNKASICPVVVEGTAEQVEFAWCGGVGHSTGIGMGSLI